MFPCRIADLKTGFRQKNRGLKYQRFAKFAKFAKTSSQIGLGTVDFSIENTGLHNVSTPVEPLTSAK